MRRSERKNHHIVLMHGKVVDPTQRALFNTDWLTDWLVLTSALLPDREINQRAGGQQQFAAPRGISKSNADDAVDNGLSSNVIGSALFWMLLLLLFQFEMAGKAIVQRDAAAAAVTTASLLSELINEQCRTVSSVCVCVCVLVDEQSSSYRFVLSVAAAAAWSLLLLSNATSFIIKSRRKLNINWPIHKFV